jgi:hypothetical protein
MTRPKTKILVDGGDPQETRRVSLSGKYPFARNSHITYVAFGAATLWKLTS